MRELEIENLQLVAMCRWGRLELKLAEVCKQLKQGGRGAGESELLSGGNGGAEDHEQGASLSV